MKRHAWKRYKAPLTPWIGEPNRVQWVSKNGFDCLIVRGPFGGLCGYVGVPPESPLYGMHYDSVDVEVHGGLTYSNTCQGEICHEPGPGRPHDVWWFGFDCGHSGDILPRCPFPPMPGASYKTIEFVRAQVEHLAAQIPTARTL